MRIMCSECCNDCDDVVRAEDAEKLVQKLADTLPEHLEEINTILIEMFPWHMPLETTSVVKKCQFESMGCSHPENGLHICTNPKTHQCGLVTGKSS